MKKNMKEGEKEKEKRESVAKRGHSLKRESFGTDRKESA